MAAWNCNGTLRSDPGGLMDLVKDRDIVFLSETHETTETGLPEVSGYSWDSVYRREKKGKRGSGGVAVLYKSELSGIISIVKKDEAARFMWIKIQTSSIDCIHIGACYFPPQNSDYTDVETQEGASPYMALFDDIAEFSRQGKILLVGDFNARTADAQVQLVDFEADPVLLPSLSPAETDSLRESADYKAEITRYGHFLLEFGQMHNLIIYNGMQQWPGSSNYTCNPQSGGHSVVDYLLGSPALTREIDKFSVPPQPPTGDHSPLLFCLKTCFELDTCLPREPPYLRFEFDHSLDLQYNLELDTRLRDIHMSQNVEEKATMLTAAIHQACLSTFPHKLCSSRKQCGLMPQNVWYDEECKSLHKHLKEEMAACSPTVTATKKVYKQLIRRKKRIYIKQLREDMLNLMYSDKSAKFWQKILAKKSDLPLKDPEVWTTYARTLLDVEQADMLDLKLQPRPQSVSLFSTSLIREAMSRMNIGKAKDCEDLQAEFLIHGMDTLAHIVADLFNEIICSGFPKTWTINIIKPIFKAGDPMNPNNYRLIMIGHVMARLYGSALDLIISEHAEINLLRAKGQGGFRRNFSTIDHIFTLRSIIEEAKAAKKKVYCCFVDFRKAFDTVPRNRLFHRLVELGLSQQIIWAVLTLYENVLGRIKVPGGWSDEINSTIGVKQGCPLSPTLFGLYIDELETFVAALGGDGSALAEECISILLYADDVVLISSSPEGLQLHLLALEKFCMQRELKVNLDKTKVMVFNTSRACMHRNPFFFMDQQVEVVSHYTYLGAQFKGPIFSMKDAAHARLTKGYASLAMLEKRCFQSDFQDVPAKLHLFNTLVRPAALYGASMWGMDMTAKEWAQIERLQIYFLSKMIMSKASVPHPIMLAEFSATPLQLDAAFQLVSFLHKVQQLGALQLGQSRLPWIALKSSKRLAEKGIQECWYAKASQWAVSLGFGLQNLPPFQYNMAAASTAVNPKAKKRSQKDKNQLIRHELELSYISRTWLTPRDLPTKMQFYKDHFLEISEDGFIERPGYLNIHLAHKVRHATGQLRVSSHQLEIEAGRAIRPKVERTRRVCRLCHLNAIETEEHFIFTCPVYYEIRGRFHCLFREPTSLPNLIRYEDQKCIALFLHQMTVHRRNLLKEQAGGRDRQGGDPTQRQITLFLIGGSDNKRKSGPPPAPNAIPRGIPMKVSRRRKQAVKDKHKQSFQRMNKSDITSYFEPVAKKTKTS